MEFNHYFTNEELDQALQARAKQFPSLVQLKEIGKSQAVRPVTAEIKVAEGCRIALAKPRMEIGHLEGRANKDDAASVFGRSPTDNCGHIQWIVEGPAGSTVEFVIRSERAGQIRRTLNLE